MPWHAEPWHRPTLARYRELLRLRRAEPALRHGGLRLAHADADTLAFWRESRAERLLVLARRAPGAAGAPARAWGRAVNLYGGARQAPVRRADLPGVVGAMATDGNKD